MKSDKDKIKDELEENEYITLHLYKDGSVYACSKGMYVHIVAEDEKVDEKKKYRELYKLINKVSA